MREVRQLTVGLINTSTRSVVAAGVLSRFSSVLLTSIDSTIDLPASTIGKRIMTFDPTCAFLGQGVVIAGKLLARLGAAMDLFNGFDELWCFERHINKPKPNDLWIVSPFNIETDPLPPSLSSWMTETDCKLGLGDGIGLNFVTPQKEVASILQRLAD